jgi:hypothetical protein
LVHLENDCRNTDRAVRCELAIVRCRIHLFLRKSGESIGSIESGETFLWFVCVSWFCFLKPNTERTEDTERKSRTTKHANHTKREIVCSFISAEIRLIRQIRVQKNCETDSLSIAPDELPIRNNLIRDDLCDDQVWHPG